MGLNCGLRAESHFLVHKLKHRNQNSTSFFRSRTIENLPRTNMKTAPFIYWPKLQAQRALGAETGSQINRAHHLTKFSTWVIVEIYIIISFGKQGFLCLSKVSISQKPQRSYEKRKDPPLYLIQIYMIMFESVHVFLCQKWLKTSWSKEMRWVEYDLLSLSFVLSLHAWWVERLILSFLCLLLMWVYNVKSCFHHNHTNTTAIKVSLLQPFKLLFWTVMTF